MRSQSSVFLRALYLLLCMAPVFHGESDSQNNTTITMRTTEYNTNATESASPKTMPPINTTTFTTKTHDISRINTSSESTPLLTTRARSDTTQTTTTSSSDAGTVVYVILFFVILIIVLSICTYKWYIRQGRPSFPEIQRHIAESVRNAWAATMECLRQSSKEEEEEEMEAGISEAEEQKKKEEDAEDEDEEEDDDDSSADYSSMDGTVMMEKPKKDEQEDGQSNEREEDMTTIELMDEKMEKEKDDLTVL